MKNTLNIMLTCMMNPAIGSLIKDRKVRNKANKTSERVFNRKNLPIIRKTKLTMKTSKVMKMINKKQKK